MCIGLKALTAHCNTLAAVCVLKVNQINFFLKIRISTHLIYTVNTMQCFYTFDDFIQFLYFLL